jgi:small subunit ribosomal protein S17
MAEIQEAVMQKPGEPRGQRHEMVGIVTSDRMTKTVVVTVDRLVRHPFYGRVVRRQSKFMAHDELGCHVGDKVRIVETRPLSARKRWRVVEVIQRSARPVEEQVVTDVEETVGAGRQTKPDTSSETGSEVTGA